MVYTAAYTARNRLVLDIVVALWLDMCPDDTLSGKLLERGISLYHHPGPTRAECEALQGVLQKVLQLLAIPVDRGRVLQALSILTKTDERRRKVWVTVLSSNTSILDVLRDNGDDPSVTKFALAVIAHSLQSTYTRGPPVNKSKGLSPVDINVTELFKLTMNSLDGPFPGHGVVLHALTILDFCVRVYAHGSTQPITPALHLLAAFTRSANISLRCVAVSALESLATSSTDPAPAPVPVPARSLARVLEDCPLHLRQLMENYGMERCELMEVERVSIKIVDILRIFVEDRDLYRLGTTLAYHLVRTTYTSRYDQFPDFAAAGVPREHRWKQCMRAAAEVLRERGDDAHLDMADVLDLEYMFSTSPPDRIVAFARKVLRRNPRHAFAHFCLCSNLPVLGPGEALQFATQGLELPDASPYMRRAFLTILLELSHTRAWNLLLGASPADAEMRKEGIVALEDALRYADMFFPESPPDCQALVRFLNRYITDTLILRGAGIGEDLSELQVCGNQLAVILIRSLMSVSISSLQ